jgi:CRP-like cAMP-binding protein
MSKLSKEQRRALQEEQATLRKRLAEIKETLAPRPVSEEARIVLAAAGPVSGDDVAQKTGKTIGATVNSLTRAVRLGIISKPKRGVYCAPVSP